MVGKASTPEVKEEAARKNVVFNFQWFQGSGEKETGSPFGVWVCMIRFQRRGAAHVQNTCYNSAQR